MAQPHRIRVKNLIANTQSNDQRNPSDEETAQFTSAMIFKFPGQYQQLLDAEGLVINPANPDDPLDIGTLTDPEDPSSFVPLSATGKADIYAAQLINLTRKYWDDVHTEFFVNVGDVSAGDVGKDVAEAAKRIRDDAKAQSAIIIGTPEGDLPDDPEATGAENP
jgi:hypothetical protein